MKFMDKIVQLPKITLRELEEKLRVQSNSPKQSACSPKDAVPSSWHSKDIKISSPFYLKQQHHKEKCECQYHRMKRAYHESIQRLRKKEQYEPFQLTKTQPTQLHNSHHESTARQKEPTQRLSAYRLLVPLGGNGTAKDDKEQEREGKETWRDRQLMGERSVKLQKITKRQCKDQDEQNNTNTIENSNLKTNKSLKSKPQILGSLGILQAGTASCRINTNNSEFISLISQRLQNNKYKDKYLKTLFSFIKMKTNTNKQYMWDSKAYLENNLNVLLNHYNMKKLVQVDELQQDQTQKIAYYMNCLPQKVPVILGELGMAVSEMEQFLNQLKKKRIETAGVGSQVHPQNSDIFENLFDTDGSTKGDANDPSRLTNTTKSLLCEQDSNQNSSTHNILTNRFNVSAEDEEKQNSLHTKGINLRKSRREMGEFQSQSRLKRSSQQKKEDTQAEERNRTSVRHSKTIPDSMNRSTRSTVLGIVDEVEKQHRFSKRLKKTKHKKIQFLKRYSDIQLDEKYSSINYQKFCQKKTFISLINSIERLDQNDTERAQHFYRELNVEQFLENAEKINELVRTFQSLMSDKTKEQLMKHIVAVRDKRYIEKLQRELDDMLGEIKKNDPRRHNEDFFQIRENSRAATHQQNNIVEFKHHKPERTSTINKIIYYEANDQIQKQKELQKEIKLDLAQTDLKEIVLEDVKPGLVQSIYHSAPSKKEIEYERPIALPNLHNQKKILQFMKRNFSTTFNYLAHEIHTICRSLEKESI